MVEELKLAIKVDDDAIEQSLLKQFANAEKMANKVVLTFNNIDLDDKAIEAKFKEMQKMAGKNPIDLSIDKSSIEMLSAISKQLGNIFDIAKGKSIIDSSATVSEINKITQATKELNKAQTGSENIQSKSFTTKNKTEAYNQLKQMADVFKNFYGNEEAMHTKAGTEAAYAYYKAYEEALRKGVAESKLQKVTVDVDKDGFFNAERISSTRIEEFANFEKYGGEVTALSEEISYFEKRLLKFSDAYSQIQSKLGKAPITPEIIQNIEEYVRNLEIAESRVKDADLMGFTKEDIDIYKDSANMYLGFAIEDAIKENEKYISSLKEVSEEKEKVDVSLNKSQTSDIDSSVVEQQNKIQEELKETQKQAEQTSEALSKIGDVDKSNISSGTQMKDVFQGDDKSETDASTTAIKEESQALEQVSTSAKEAATSKEKFANANKEVKASADETVISVDKEISALEKAGSKFESQAAGLAIKPDGQHQFSSWKKQLEDLNIEIAEYKSKVENLSKIDIADEAQINKAKTEIEELGKSIKETINVMTKIPQSKRGWTDIGASKAAEKVANVLKQNTKMSKEAKDAIRAYYNELRSGNPSQPIDEILVKVNQLVQKERELGRVGKSFGEIFKEKVIYGGAAQLAGMVGFYDVINGIRECITTVRELDTALTEMRKVSDEGLASLKNYQNISFDVADEIGSTALALQDATATWMRLGESLSEASESAKDATILMNVSEFESIDEATDSLVSMSQAFKELDKMEIIDVLDKIGNEYSISTDNLSRALQDSAAVLKTQGNDLYESVALITAGNAINQDYSKTAGGVRTISLRLAGTEEAKEELSSLGEDVDDFIVQTNSKTQELIKDYTAVASNAYKGIDVLDANGNLRNTYNILLDISKIYKEIQEEDKKAGTNRAQALVEYIAGKNRSNIASSILLNPELLESVYESAKNADGAAMKELDAYMESLDAKVAQFQNRLQELESDLVNSDFLKGAIDFGTEFIHILDEIINKFGVLPTIMAGVGAGLGIKNIGREKCYPSYRICL